MQGTVKKHLRFKKKMVELDDLVDVKACMIVTTNETVNSKVGTLPLEVQWR